MEFGKLLMIGVEGREVTAQTERLLKSTGCGGVILFTRNYSDPEQLRRFILDLHSAAGRRLLISIDQEGGRVARLRDGFTLIPPMERIGRAAKTSPDAPFKVAQVIGEELAATGIDLDFAPVLDVATNPANPVIGDRSFSADPAIVARCAASFIEGLHSVGVASCGKHFPGHGDTDVDSHLDLPFISHGRDRLEFCELIPFREAITAGVASIMTAHIMMPAIDSKDPVTISHGITTGILRRALGFDGLVFTDDLTMKGIEKLHDASEASWRALKAGADVVLVCSDEGKERAALDGIARAIADGRLDHEDVEASIERFDALVSRFCVDQKRRPDPSCIGSEEHRRIVSDHS